MLQATCWNVPNTSICNGRERPWFPKTFKGQWWASGVVTVTVAAAFVAVVVRWFKPYSDYGEVSELESMKRFL